MLLLVRDEEDIIRANVEFHRKLGVNHFIVTDNASSDGTRTILEEYEKLGIMTVIHEPEHNYQQKKWVNRMAQLAINEYEADWVISNDADEFWLPKEGNLSETLATWESDMMVCPKKNMVFRNDKFDEFPWLEEIIYCVHTPYERPVLNDPISDPFPKPFYFWEFNPKAIVRANSLVEFGWGNHTATLKMLSDPKEASIEVYHFPVRSYSQLQNKVINGGSAYANNTEASHNVGWHWRRWYNKFQKGQMAEIFRETMPTFAQITTGINDGHIAMNTSIRDLLLKVFAECKSQSHHM